METEPVGLGDAAPKIEAFEYPVTPWSRARQGLTEAELQIRFAEMFPGAGAHEVVPEAGWPLGSGFPGVTESRREDENGNGEATGTDAAEAEVAELLVSLNENDKLTRLMAAQSRIAEERGFRRGIEQGLAKGEEYGRSQGQALGLSQSIVQAREEAANQLETARNQLFAQARALVESFDETREQYLHALEEESVRLALAIAARVLRREAQVDPLLLTGAVRVALGQLAESTTVRLRVPLEDKSLWQEALAHLPGLMLRPQVIGEPEMELGDCRMEAELGSANLGLGAQLKEIERGFFDHGGAPVSESMEAEMEPVVAPARAWQRETPTPTWEQPAQTESQIESRTESKIKSKIELSSEVWAGDVAEVSR